MKVLSLILGGTTHSIPWCTASVRKDTGKDARGKEIDSYVTSNTYTD